MNVKRVLVSVYVLIGCLAGLAGFILSARLGSAEAVAGISFELRVIASVVIGGTSLMGGYGRIGGTIIGSIIMGILINGLVLMNVSAYYQQIITGLIIVLAVAFDTYAKSRRGAPVRITMKEVRIGLIGTGYIGKAHAIAYAQAPTVFNLRGRLVREMVAEVTPELAAARAQAFGFNRSTGDWRALVADPAIDVVDICSPNHLHKEMALEAIRHGKHVYWRSRWRLMPTTRARWLTPRSGPVKTLVGFNHEEPDGAAGEEIIARGEIGEVIHFYGTHNEDYMADPLSPIHWHCFKETAGLGALGDLAAHIVNMAQYLVGISSRSAAI